MGGCAFTGHRYVSPSHEPYIRNLIARAIRFAYGEGCREFYNGGAVGFDLLAAEVFAAISDELPDARLILLLPCANHDSRWDRFDRERLSRVLSLADEVICLSPRYYNGCMLARNRELVLRSEIVIAYLGRDEGGTAYTVRLAKSRGARVFNIFPSLEGMCD
ncbi:MAG: DUF1273 family protein [Clostridia bacterium]|nr:DUF1273 family protein [Clostridia bacterium]